MSAIPESGTANNPARKAMAISTTLATLLAGVVLLTALGHKQLTAWDEGIYAEVSREMLGHSWLVPHWNGQLWLEKPPLMLWITAAFFKLLGVHEFPARLGSALAGVAIVAIIHRWLLAKHDRLAAWLSTFFLLSTFGFLHICSLGEMDVLLSLGCLLALFGLARVQTHDLSGWYWFWAGFAIALMTKGAASIVVLLALIAIFVAERWKTDRLGKPFVLGFLWFLLLVLPWHLFMFQRFGREFVREYLGFHVISRATVQIEGHITHPWYYLGVLLASAPPWVVLYPFAIAASFRNGFRHSRLRECRLFSVFALLVLAFFSIIQTRLPHYIAPMYPPLTILAAMYAADKLREWHVPEGRFARRIAWVLAAGTVWGLSAWATNAPRKRLHSARLTQGAPPPDGKEVAQLLQAVRRHPDLPGGSMLIWNAASSVPIAPAVFYIERPVQQVQLVYAPPDSPRDKYMFDPQTLGLATADGPHLLLLDQSLLSSLPADYSFQPLEARKTMAVGVVSRVQKAPPGR